LSYCDRRECFKSGFDDLTDSKVEEAHIKKADEIIWLVFSKKSTRRKVMIKIIPSSIVTAFSTKTIGSKVVDSLKFEGFLEKAILQHDVTKDKVTGQHFLPLPNEAFETVSAGVGVRTDNLEDYILREYRGQVDVYLKRELVAPVESLAAIVYTVEAYLADPDVRPEEAVLIKDAGATHMLVAVLASAGPRAPLSPKRLVHNLAGGNKEALAWTADEIRTKAAETKTYHDQWCVVAD
jgi:hypothetical protein